MSAGDSIGGKRKVEFIPIEVLEAECNSLGNRLKNEIKKAHIRINDLEEELLTKDENFSKDLKQKQDRCNSLSLEMTKQQEENVKLKKEIQQLEKSHSREQLYLTNMNEENKKHIESLNAHIKSMNTEIQELNCEHSKETEQLKFDLNEAKHALTCKFNEDRVRKTEMEYTIHKLEEENVKFCEMVKNLNAEIKILKSKMELTQTREDKLEQQIKNMEEIVKKKEGEIKDFYKRTSENNGYIEKLQTRIQEITSQKRKEDDKHQEYIKELQESVSDERKNFYDLSYMYNQLIQQKNAFAENLIQVNKEKTEIEHEKQELMLRLSKLAGTNSTYNNPNIADLSDEKRPTKLAEEFSELYDNEWTDAFEDMPIEDERQKITLMMEMLKHANQLCNELATEHRRKIKQSFCTLTFHESLSAVESDEKIFETDTKQATDAPRIKSQDRATTTGLNQDEGMCVCDSKTENEVTEIGDEINKNFTTQTLQNVDVGNDEDAGTDIKEDVQVSKGKDLDTGNEIGQLSGSVGDANVENEGCSEEDNEKAEDDGNKTGQSSGSAGDIGIEEGPSLEGNSNVSNERKVDVGKDADTDAANKEYAHVSKEKALDVGKETDQLSGCVEYANVEIHEALDVSNEKVQDNGDRKVACFGSAGDAGTYNIEGSDVLREGTSGAGNATDSNICSDGGSSGVHKSYPSIFYKGDHSDSGQEKNSHSGTEGDVGAGNERDMQNTSDGKGGKTLLPKIVKRKIELDFEQNLKNEQKKTIMEIGKVFESKLSENVENIGTEIILKEHTINQGMESVVAYIRKSINICWSMCRHVPPVHVEFPDVTEDTHFDANKYKPYTKSGKYVHYIVWPALYLLEHIFLTSHFPVQCRSHDLSPLYQEVKSSKKKENLVEAQLLSFGGLI